MHAEEQHAQLRQTLTKAAGGFQAADAGQADIHDHQVGNLFLHPLQRLLTIAGLAQLHVRQQGAQQAGVALAYHGVIVHQ